MPFFLTAQIRGSAPPRRPPRPARKALALFCCCLCFCLQAVRADAGKEPHRRAQPIVRAGLEQNPPLSFITPEGEAAHYAAPSGTYSELLDAIDHHLEQLKADPGSPYYRSLERWLGVPGERGLPHWLKLGLAAATGAVLLLLGAVLLFRSQLKGRTRHLEQVIAERIRAEQSLRQSEANYRELVENANSVILRLDAAGRIIFFNEFAEQLFGYPKEEVVGRDLLGTIIPEWGAENRGLARMLGNICRDPEAYAVSETECVRKNGERFWVSWTLRPLCSSQEQFEGILAVGQDISERRRFEAQLAYQANYDRLTGLPNRTLFRDRLGQAMARDGEHRCGLAVILLDLDNFKMINDTLGHSAGDALLQQVAERIAGRLRKTDTLARFGGDEFVILVPDLTEARLAGEIAQHIIDGLEAPFFVDGGELYVRASLGIATYPEDADSIETLLKNADAAMYDAKRQGKNTFQFFVTEINRRIHDRLEIETLLRGAQERGEFFLQYQPQLESGSGRVVGVEALLRWQPHGEMTVMPDSFVAVLEETGLIVPVGEWVLREACRQLRQWHLAGDPQLRMSVNISARQFEQGRLEERVPAILAETGLEPDRLCLEVTESLIMHDSEETIRRMARLRQAGIVFSIDDFGTGYSSLRYLKSMPVSELKVDRSFVANIPASARDAAIVVSVIQIARQLNLRVVAEGVESSAQLQFLADSGCQVVQGYLLSEPLHAEAVDSFLGRAPIGLFTGKGPVPTP